jgi:hypothetical protein
LAGIERILARVIESVTNAAILGEGEIRVVKREMSDGSQIRTSAAIREIRIAEYEVTISSIQSQELNG